MSGFQYMDSSGEVVGRHDGVGRSPVVGEHWGLRDPKLGLAVWKVLAVDLTLRTITVERANLNPAQPE